MPIVPGGHRFLTAGWQFGGVPVIPSGQEAGCWGLGLRSGMERTRQLGQRPICPSGHCRTIGRQLGGVPVIPSGQDTSTQRPRRPRLKPGSHTHSPSDACSFAPQTGSRFRSCFTATQVPRILVNPRSQTHSPSDRCALFPQEDAGLGGGAGGESGFDTSLGLAQIIVVPALVTRSVVQPFGTRVTLVNFVQPGRHVGFPRCGGRASRTQSCPDKR